ncbi:MAG: chromate resistance protein [Betaproteobacteria bacterium]|nr:chromate resistance protein [Betaproteobacteria bacterium]
MDTVPLPASPSLLLSSVGTPAAPLVIDVRRRAAFDEDPVLIAGATWRDPFAVGEWEKYLPRHRPVVLYCVHGHEVSRNASAALRTAGVDARYLEGGMEAWRALGAPTVLGRRHPAVPSEPGKPSVWVTRERPKIDRIACPWLVRRFIDPFAEFVFVAEPQVRAVAAQRGGIAFDIPGVDFTHRGERCSFDALVDDFGLEDKALARLARIVRGADTGRLELAPECAGLLAVSLGLGSLHRDDCALLEKAFLVYDALYATCRAQAAGKAEPHTWNTPS